MKKSVLLLTGVSFMILTGCSTTDQAKTGISTTSDKSSVLSESSTRAKESSNSQTEKSLNTAESIDIFAKGDYIVGTDIEPGTYYAVLTELNYADDDTDKSAYVSMDVSGGKYDHEMFKQVGAKKRFTLSDGDTVTLNDNYSPLSWTLKLLDDADFQKYLQDNH